MHSKVKPLVESKAGKPVVEIGYESTSAENETFKKVHWDHVDDQILAKRKSMMEHQPIYSLKVRNSIVTELSSLITLLSHNAYSDRGRLDHVDIVTSISNGAGELIRVSFYKFYYFCLFIWRRSEHNNRR